MYMGERSPLLIIFRENFVKKIIREFEFHYTLRLSIRFCRPKIKLIFCFRCAIMRIYKRWTSPNDCFGSTVYDKVMHSTAVVRLCPPSKTGYVNPAHKYKPEVNQPTFRVGLLTFRVGPLKEGTL